MTRAAIAVAVIAASVGAGSAVASRTGFIWAQHAGIRCAFGTGAQGRGVLCMRTTKRAYMVTLTDRRVVVWLDGKQVFMRRQP